MKTPQKEQPKENKPLMKYKSGMMTATIWNKEVEKDGKTYEFQNVEIVKNYPKEKDKEGKVIEWAKTSNYNKEDLPHVKVVLDEAIRFLFLNE
jgi:hypothetical protein